MHHCKTPMALAVCFAVGGILPLAAHAAPTVSFKAPTRGKTIAGNLHQSAACEVGGSNIRKVVFFLDSSQLNTEGSAPWQCNLDTRKFSNGTHALKALAYDSAGVSRSASISVNIQNSGTTTNTPPAVSFKSPAGGQTVSGGLSTCEAAASDGNGIQKVDFFLGATLYHTELLAPYTCGFDTTKFADGAYTLKAVATDKLGATNSAQISLNIKNGTGTTTNTPPSVSFTAPAAGATLSGTVSGTGCAANASGSNGSVAKVDFFLVNASAAQTLVTSDSASPYQCSFASTAYPNGTYTLMAVATDNQGATASTQRSVTINNTVVSDPGTTPDPGTGTGAGTSLPSTNAKAVATFESLGLYWKPGTNPGAAGCTVRYRKASESAWKEGLAMWYDSRDGECRGSLVQLAPGTSYAVEMGLPGKPPSAGLNTKTWSEQFPIAKTVTVGSSSQTLKITEGGSASGYVLYTSAPGTQAVIDVANAADYNVTISAPFVIVRGLVLKNARIDGIRMLQGAKDIVIEDNDISGWGRLGTKVAGDWKVGVDRDSAIRAQCDATPWLERVVIQRNKLHHPRYTANSWDWGHPEGPQGVTFNQCGGNHVLRYNEVYSSDGGNYFNDGFSGGENFSAVGFPNSDSDIYGNKISHTWDDGIEAEGGNRNVRVWGNYIDQTNTGIASTVVHYGPLYIFRNVYNRSRSLSQKPLDSDSRNSYFKAGAAGGFGNGRRFVFHNTMLQATQSGTTYPLGAGAGLKGNTNQPMTNTLSRNNIYHVWKSNWNSVEQQSGSFGNDANYDLFNGGIGSFAGAEANGILGTPIYKAGNGWSNWSGGMYQLDPRSPGYDKGVRIPNFNDAYTGAGPDMGAHEADTPAMRFGVQAP